MQRRSRVAILGANGQVGNELALLMHLSDDVHPVAVARSSYSLAPLKMLGLECHVARSNTELAEVLGGCDAAVEMVHPWHPNIPAMRRTISERCRLIDAALPQGSPVVYSSTQSVYRLEPHKARFTLYGSTKRYAEREITRLGKRSGRPVCVLRLGQVNGAMQSATLSVMDTLKRHHRVRVPDIRSFTVFVTSIEETVRRFVSGELAGDIYTMISSPAWSYAELTEWMAAEIGLQVEIETVPAPRLPHFSFKASARQAVSGLMNRHKDALTMLTTTYAPDLFERSRQKHWTGMARAQITAHDAALAPMLFTQYVDVPGRRVPGLTDSRQTMPARHAQLKQLLSKLSA